MKRRSFLKSVACCVAGAALSLGMMRRPDAVAAENLDAISLPTGDFDKLLKHYEKFVLDNYRREYLDWKKLGGSIQTGNHETP